MYARISGLYQTISYGQHKLTFREATDNGRFFVSKHPSYYYRENYDPKKHVRGYGMLGVDFQAAGRRFGRGQRQGGITFEIGSDVGTRDTGDDLLLPLEMVHWTLAHEYGHWLGLGHRRPAWGIYSLMSDKLYTTEHIPEFGPAPLDIFQIMQLGWLKESDSTRVRVVQADSVSTEITLRDIRSPEGIVLCKIIAPDTRSSFYICYHRRHNPYDKIYRGEGLLLWQKKGRTIAPMPASFNSAANHSPQEGGSPTDFITTRHEFKIQSARGQRQQGLKQAGRNSRLQILDIRQRDERSPIDSKSF